MKNIIRAILLCGALSALFILGGCGSGGWGGVSGVTVSSPAPAPAPAPVNTYSLSRDDLMLQIANDLTTENNAGGFILRAAESSNADGVINAGDVFRIDVLKQDQIETGIANNVATANPLCTISFFDGERSSMLTTTSGTITFTKYGTKNNEEVSGTFDVTVDDGSGILKYVSGRFDYFLSFSI